MPSSSFSSSSFLSLFSLLCLALTLSATLSSAASFPLARRVLSPSFNPSKSGLGSRPINAKAAAASRPRAMIPKKFWSRGEFDPSTVVENKKVKPARSRRSAGPNDVVLSNGFYSSGQCTAEIPNRLMRSASFSSDVMTYSLCTSFCFNQGFSQAGVEWGRECYCSSTVDLSSTTASNSCNVPCSGDPSNICGGPQALQIFQSDAPVEQYRTLENGWTATNVCLADGLAGGRTFSGASLNSDDLTQETCTTFCEENGYTQAGMEYASQCYCSSSVDVNSAQQSTGCNMACSGDQTEVCGGGNALTVFLAPQNGDSGGGGDSSIGIE